MRENSKHEISVSFYKKRVENEKNKNLTKAVFFYQKSLTENLSNSLSLTALIGLWYRRPGVQTPSYTTKNVALID